MPENFHDAVEDVFLRTLRGMNEGKSPDTLASEIRLPPKYADPPYLREHYGSVEWTIPAVYAAYPGWFDGNPTRLHPLSPEERAAKTVARMGGREAVDNAAEKTLESGEHHWCLELCDLLLTHEGESGRCADARPTRWKNLRSSRRAPMEDTTVSPAPMNPGRAVRRKARRGESCRGIPV